MRRCAKAALQALIVLLGLAVLAFLFWEPTVEGRNAHVTLFQTYFTDPFLAYVYVSSIPFFVALVQAFRALGGSLAADKALRNIKRCAFALIGLVAVSLLFMVNTDRDDRPAGLFMRMLVLLPSIAVAGAARRLERPSDA